MVEVEFKFEGGLSCTTEIWNKRTRPKSPFPLDNSFRTIRPLVIILFFLKHPWQSLSEEKLLATFDELNRKIQQTAGSLCAQFEQDYLRGVESLFREHFDEYRVYLDFIADKLGMSPAIREKAQEIYDSLSDDMRQQVLAYQNGARNSFWMINRSNLKYIVDNDLISLIPSE